MDVVNGVKRHQELWRVLDRCLGDFLRSLSADTETLMNSNCLQFVGGLHGLQPLLQALQSDQITIKPLRAFLQKYCPDVAEEVWELLRSKGLLLEHGFGWANKDKMCKREQHHLVGLSVSRTARIPVHLLGPPPPPPPPLPAPQPALLPAPLPAAYPAPAPVRERSASVVMTSSSAQLPPPPSVPSLETFPFAWIFKQPAVLLPDSYSLEDVSEEMLIEAIEFTRPLRLRGGGPAQPRGKRRRGRYDDDDDDYATDDSEIFAPGDRSAARRVSSCV